MASDPAFGMGGFLPGMLGDLMKLLKTDAPLQWDLAVQLAVAVATDNAAEANVDPLARIRLEELVRLAELHVADVAAMTVTGGGGQLRVGALSRGEWARRSLESWRPLLHGIAEAMSAPVPTDAGEAPAEVPATGDEGDEGLAALFSQWSAVLSPAILAMQIGSVVGHLARRTLGQYELPLPRADDELLVVSANLDEFAADWSLPLDDLRLYLAIRDVSSHAVLRRDHVRRRLEELLVAHAACVRPDPRALEAHLGGSGGADLDELTRLLGDPSAFGQIAASADLARVRTQLDAFLATFAGYVDWVTDTVATRIIGARAAVREALLRRRSDPGDESRGAENLFGLRIDHDLAARGSAFVHGVLERGGETELAKLWVVAANLPTPAEVDAPGLWIERVNLPELDPPS